MLDEITVSLPTAFLRSKLYAVRVDNELYPCGRLHSVHVTAFYVDTDLLARYALIASKAKACCVYETLHKTHVESLALALGRAPTTTELNFYLRTWGKERAAYLSALVQAGV